jgi:hypothetical protein
LQDEEVYLVGTFNGAALPTGSSSESISRRLAAKSRSARAAQAEASLQRDRVHTESRRVKQVERIAKVALADRARDAERRALEEMTGAHPAPREGVPNKLDPGK